MNPYPKSTSFLFQWPSLQESPKMELHPVLTHLLSTGLLSPVWWKPQHCHPLVFMPHIPTSSKVLSQPSTSMCPPLWTGFQSPPFISSVGNKSRFLSKNKLDLGLQKKMACLDESGTDVSFQLGDLWIQWKHYNENYKMLSWHDWIQRNSVSQSSIRTYSISVVSRFLPFKKYPYSWKFLTHKTICR